ncbi:phosphotransferase enzyme family protein [Acaryochloris sp. CCMEE 5410]|uniref:phosphotransferase enzyme family protein n=1 Tax=Acaryochloris sp. CCMEE 5410 TaxID=310037 RepID=UPI00024849B3|nr:aminoglycoside phosphotransferase family protein [Acaryochloris sp. CCMEE 5410]KAI9133298.1 aminoglycoside phosphotransferase family protein [Acaryochloris sp. CCMEE 5410]
MIDPLPPGSSPWLVAEQFKSAGTIVDVQEFGQGNINSTFLVTLDTATDQRFILQRINTQVFQQPQLVMRNIRTYSEHVCQRLQADGCQRRWEVPQVLLTSDRQDHWVSPNGDFWRAMSFVETAQALQEITTPDQAEEVGYALGMFHHLISDLPAEHLADTLEGFHITPQYLQQFEQVQDTRVELTPEVEYCLQFVCDRKQDTNILEAAKAEGKLRLRLMHGDPKINNILMDTDTQQAVSVIDLDTVKPGLIHYDIGDCLRSGCNPLGEETEQWEMVHFDLKMCQRILQGYLAVAQSFLTADDYDYLYDAIRLIAFELGLRFFTDYLAGNVYFKVDHPDHNLNRALVQFKLTESIEAQSDAIQALIQSLR